MSVRYALGDRGGALKVAHDFAQRLSLELQTDLMPETLALRESILQNLPLPETQSPEGKDENARKLLPFAGRAAELRRLTHVWNRAARGHGGAVLIGGEPGIGKSRLVHEFALLAQKQGARVFVGGTSSPEHRAYQAISEALLCAAPLLVRADIEPQWLASLAHVLPQLQTQRSDLPELAPLNDERERVRMFQACAVAFEGLAQDRPVVLVLEDLHWAGPASIAVFESLVHRLAERPVFIIATYRDIAQTHALRAVRESLLQSSAVEEVILGRLSREAVDEMLHRLRGEGRCDDAIARVYERSEGYPLFLDAIVYAPDPAHDSAASTSGLDAIIAERLRTLPDEVRALAEIAAIAGDGFTVDLLRDVAGSSEVEIFDALAMLEAQRLVRERRRKFDLVFSHNLIRESIYATAAPETRKRRHRRIAQVLERYAGGARYARQIALHYERGGERDLAATHYLSAAQAAAGVYAPQESLEAADRGLALAVSDKLRSRLLLVHERAAALLGMRKEQRADTEELERLAVVLDDAELAVTALQRKIAWARSVADTTSWANGLEKLTAAVWQSRDPLQQARLLVQEAGYASYIGNYESAQQALHERSIGSYTAVRRVRSKRESIAIARCSSWRNSATTSQGSRDASRKRIFSRVTRRLIYGHARSPPSLTQPLRAKCTSVRIC